MLPMEMARPAIEVQRERAERLLNGVRAAVLVALACAAIVYAPHIPLSVQRASYSDLMEKDVPPVVRIEGSSVRIHVKPFEIQTIKITVPDRLLIMGSRSEAPIK